MRARRPDANGFIGKTDMQGVAVGFRIDRHGLDAKFPAGAKDSKRNFAAIGDQDFSEHFTEKGSLEKGHPDKRSRARSLLLAMRVDAEEGLAIFHRMPIFNEDPHHLARHIRLDFVHQLHRFDDAEHLAGFHVRARGDKRRRCRGWPTSRKSPRSAISPRASLPSAPLPQQPLCPKPQQWQQPGVPAGGRRGNYDFGTGDGPEGSLPDRGRLLQPDPESVALVLEFLEPMLLHEVEHTLDFGQVNTRCP